MSRHLLFVLLLFVLSCSPPEKPAATGGPRLAVTNPGAAEILDSLGALDRVVAVGDFVDWPPAVTRLPKIGSFERPNVERLLAVRAEVLVATLSRASSPAHQRLRQLGVRVLELDTGTYAGVLAAIDELGRLVHREPQAAALAAGIRGGLEEVRRRAASLPKRRVLFVVGQDPLFAAGPGSHLDELIAVAGGVNVAADTGASYAMLSLEVALERQPEVILDTSDNRPGALRGRKPGGWGRWPFLPAVRANRVYWIDPARLNLPGPRLPAMARLMAKLLHPEVFGEASDEEMGPLTPRSPLPPALTSPGRGDASARATTGGCPYPELPVGAGPRACPLAFSFFFPLSRAAGVRVGEGARG